MCIHKQSGKLIQLKQTSLELLLTSDNKLIWLSFFIIADKYKTCDNDDGYTVDDKDDEESS